MNLLPIILLLTGIFLLSVVITALARHYALKRALIDVPNERSSHTEPTPRGGGISIALAMLTGSAFLYWTGYLAADLASACAGGVLIIAITGWLDDHYDLPAVLRLFSYLCAAVWGIWSIGYLQFNSMPMPGVFSSLMASGFAIVWVVWLTNLYNFMDGADGLAALQAITAGGLAGVLAWQGGHIGIGALSMIMVSASAGFLVWNWPPARIFMGDVGSCTVGYCFGLLSLSSEKLSVVPLAVWFILLGFFICDATLTLLMRMLKGEKWYSAHRSHAYQRLLQMGMTHKQLALCLLVINLALLCPLAWYASNHVALSGILAAVTGVILIILWCVVQYGYGRKQLIYK